MSPIVERLVALISTHGWESDFAQAVVSARQCNVESLAQIDSVEAYLHYIDEMVRWAPRECGDSQMVHDKLVEFYFILDQPPLRRLQSPVKSGACPSPLSPLSQWIIDYAGAWGAYLDTAESAAHVDSFRSNPAFRWDDYMPPPSGYRTFNQFFARHVKPGHRPVAAPHDRSVVVSPADAAFVGAWPIATDSTITVKGMRWSVAQLLDGSPHAQRFAGGVFTHVALRTFDYHRFHAPLEGEVIEARSVRGQAFLDVRTIESSDGATRLEAVEGTGYQFVQMRALVMLGTPAGLMACLPVGMAQVSSVVITAEPGRTLRKGEELGYFQFGGSDFVMLFEPACKVTLACSEDVHYLQGEAIGHCAENDGSD